MYMCKCGSHSDYNNIIMKKFDHIPSSCILLMVHVVKGRHYSTSHIDISASIAEMESETDSRPRQEQVSLLQS